MQFAFSFGALRFFLGAAFYPCGTCGYFQFSEIIRNGLTVSIYQHNLPPFAIKMMENKNTPCGAALGTILQNF
jgi:hypothetical protein